MRPLHVSLLTAAICVAFFGSCKKEKTLTELLTANCWIATAITIDPPFPSGSTTVSNLYAELETCLRDNIRCFEAASNYTIEEGLTKCNAANPVIYEKGTWSFSNDMHIIATPVPGNAIEMEVLELKEEVFIFRVLYDEINTTKYFATYTCEPNG